MIDTNIDNVESIVIAKREMRCFGKPYTAVDIHVTLADGTRLEFDLMSDYEKDIKLIIPEKETVNEKF